MSARLTRTLRKSRNARLGLGIVVVLLVIALTSPWLATHDPRTQVIQDRLKAPSAQYWLGTDTFGRDVFSRLVWGTRISFLLGFFSTGISSIIGTAMGIVSGYYGGWVDTIVMRVVDTLMSFPTILLAMAIVAILGPDLQNIVIAIALTFSPRFARVIRSVALSVREQGYVLAARASGVRHGSIMWKHVLPNVVSSAIVLLTMQIGTAITMEASLSFLGLGGDPAIPTWGGVINDGRGFLQQAPWISGFAGIAITVTVIGFNLLGDAIRDVLDPRFSKQL